MTSACVSLNTRVPGTFPLSSFLPFVVGNYTQAIECAKTYLLFFPNDEVMSQNLAYYTATLGEEKTRSIGPREVSLLWRIGHGPDTSKGFALWQEVLL